MAPWRRGLEIQQWPPPLQLLQPWKIDPMAVRQGQRPYHEEWGMDSRSHLTEVAADKRKLYIVRTIPGLHGQ